MELSDEQFHRYARHLILEEVGDDGQARLLGARVLAVGAGGLGSPLLMYLAAAGIGTIGIIDDDVVDLTNLQRQILHATASVGRAKTESAAETLRRINPGIQIRLHRERLRPDNALALFADYDVIADGSDNFPTRYLVNDAAFLAGRTLVSGALLRFEGQLATFRGGVPSHRGEPCYRCIFSRPPPPGAVPRCEEAGILGVVAGVVGTLQATEVVKEVLGLGESMSGWLLLYDSLATGFRRIRVRRNPNCALCGDRPEITAITDRYGR